MQVGLTEFYEIFMQKQTSGILISFRAKLPTFIKP